MADINYIVEQNIRQTNYQVEINNRVINYQVEVVQGGNSECDESMEFTPDLSLIYQTAKL